MKIVFAIPWLHKKNSVQKSFKSQPAYQLYDDYFQRIAHSFPCEVRRWENQKSPASILWVCDSQNGKMLSSENLSTLFQKAQGTSAQELCVVVGGADGLERATLQAVRPDFVWSFGPATYPHELALVIACEQIYRAIAIQKKLPYHLGHAS